MIRAFSLVLLLSLSACMAQPKRTYHPPRTKCPDLPVLPNPATEADKDQWIEQMATLYPQCAASRRVFLKTDTESK
ncbi:hypothetical protein [Robbsia andropogonis]|nr:hypothetical protein [Robbsia andropogonis]